MSCAHLKTLADIHAAAFADARPWTINEFSELLGADGSVLLQVDGAFILGRIVCDEAEILTVATHPDHQRQGLAAGLLNKFEQKVNPEVRSIFLEVSACNHPALAMYLSAGFAQVGLRRAYYLRKSGVTEDALILSKSLNGQCHKLG